MAFGLDLKAIWALMKHRRQWGGNEEKEDILTKETEEKQRGERTCVLRN